MRRPFAGLLAACLVWTSLPWQALAAETPAVRLETPGARAPAPLGALTFEINRQLVGMPGYGGNGLSFRQTQEAAARLSRLIDSPQTPPTQKAAAQVILSSLNDPEALLPELKAALQDLEIPRERALGEHTLAALEHLARKSIARRKTAAVLARAASRLELPGSLDELYDALTRPREADAVLAGSGAATLQRLQKVKAFYDKPLAGSAKASGPRKPEIKVNFGGFLANWINPNTLLARVFALGHFNALRATIARVTSRLAMPGDNPDYSVYILPVDDPHAMIDQGEARIWLTL